MEEKQESSLDPNVIDEILKKYFNTLEEQEEFKKNEIESFIEEKSSLEKQQEIIFNSDEEFRKNLFNEISKTNDYIQYNNNLIYFSLVITGTILICVLLYKILKIFI